MQHDFSHLAYGGPPLSVVLQSIQRAVTAAKNRGQAEWDFSHLAAASGRVNPSPAFRDLESFSAGRGGRLETLMGGGSAAEAVLVDRPLSSGDVLDIAQRIVALYDASGMAGKGRIGFTASDRPVTVTKG